jgi:hypothetical protein
MNGKYMCPNYRVPEHGSFIGKETGIRQDIL